MHPYTFFNFRDEKGYHGLVEAFTMNPLTLAPLDEVGEFELKPRQDKCSIRGESEAILINTDVSAPYLINIFLYDSILKAK